jgi:NSS family neurotransmitter:Na+ symporter
MLNIRRLRKYANDVSEIKIGRWWEILLKYVNPIILIILFIIFANENITSGYAGYSTLTLLIGGATLTILAFCFSFIFKKT